MTGSVGALLIPHYIFQLKQRSTASIQVIMSNSAQRFVSPYTLRLFSDHQVLTGSFQITSEMKVPHIETTQKTDLFLVMPATANVIGKAAHGICDDLISTAILACQAPIVFVPSMNQTMWSNQALQQNVERLKNWGYYVLEPSYGYEIAGMRSTYGVMPSFARILSEVKRILTSTREDEDKAEDSKRPTRLR